MLALVKACQYFSGTFSPLSPANVSMRAVELFCFNPFDLFVTGCEREREDNLIFFPILLHKLPCKGRTMQQALVKIMNT